MVWVAGQNDEITIPASGTTMWSDDAVSWHVVQWTPFDEQLVRPQTMDADRSPARWVAIGAYAFSDVTCSIITSTDGLSWSRVVHPQDDSSFALSFPKLICWNGASWLAIFGNGSTTEVYASSDGLTWSLLTAAAPMNLFYLGQSQRDRLLWCNGYWICNTTYPTLNPPTNIWRSSDGSTWSQGGAIQPTLMIGANGNTLLALDIYAQMNRSLDAGATWTTYTIPFFTGFTGGQVDLVAGASGEWYLRTSTDVWRSADDGLTWTNLGISLPYPGGTITHSCWTGSELLISVTEPVGFNFYDIYSVTSGGIVVLVQGPIDAASFPATDINNLPGRMIWRTGQGLFGGATNGPTARAAISLATASTPGGWIAVDTGDPRVLVPHHPEMGRGGSLQKVRGNGSSYFLALGFMITGGDISLMQSNADATVWSRVETPYDFTGPSGTGFFDFLDFDWDGSRWGFIGTDNGTLTFVASPDLSAWSAVALPSGLNGRTIKWTGSQWIVGGQFDGPDIAVSPDGVTWSLVSSALDFMGIQAFGEVG